MKNVAFSGQIHKYFGYFQNEQKTTNKSKNTIISYNTTLTSFIEFVEQYDKVLNFDNLKKLDIMNFLEYKNQMLQKHTELKMTSKKLYLTHLKTFFNFCVENFDVEMKVNTIFKLDIKTPKRTPKGVENKDVKIIESYLDTLEINSLVNARNSFLLKLSLYSGARRGELAVIKIDDFIESDDLYIINTIGKGDKERILYIPKEKVLKETVYYKENGINTIAITKNMKPMDGSQIYRFLNNIYKKLGIKYSGVHILRHTFAKSMISRDVNIVTVQQLLGHSSIQTTMIYTNPNQKEIQNAYQNAVKNGRTQQIDLTC